MEISGHVSDTIHNKDHKSYNKNKNKSSNNRK